MSPTLKGSLMTWCFKQVMWRNNLWFLHGTARSMIYNVYSQRGSEGDIQSRITSVIYQITYVEGTEASLDPVTRCSDMVPPLHCLSAHHWGWGEKERGRNLWSRCKPAFNVQQNYLFFFCFINFPVWLTSYSWPWHMCFQVFQHYASWNLCWWIEYNTVLYMCTCTWRGRELLDCVKSCSVSRSLMLLCM